MTRFKRIRLTIGTKLIGLIAGLLMISVGSLVWIATDLMSRENTSQINQNSADAAAALSTQTRELIQGVAQQSAILGGILLSQPKEEKALIDGFFQKDPASVAVFLLKQDPTGKVEIQASALNPELTAAYGSNASGAIQPLLTNPAVSIPKTFENGAIQALTFRAGDAGPVVGFVFPFSRQGTHYVHALATLVKFKEFAQAFNQFDGLYSYMVDSRGRLLMHPEESRALAGESVTQLEIVRKFLEGSASNHQIIYPDPATGERKLAAARAVGIAGLGVICEVPEAKAFEQARRLARLSIYFGLGILALSFLTGFLYSRTITHPIAWLSDAAFKIAKGDFNIQLPVKGQDELAHLSESFNQMAKDLAHREKVIKTFNQYHSKAVAEKILAGEVKLGGERKRAVVFFSDIRGFTAFSETMPPEGVVEMLNQYMTRMVAIIDANKGIVDKFVGDAIMATWGALEETPEDAANAVRACLAMRKDLALFNEERIAAGKPVIKMGMGLNLGEVIAGNIGSTEKVEYTVIGDTVNTASRIESMTKAYGTDLLVSQAIRDQLGETFAFESCAASKVKGKTNALQVFKVKGEARADGTIDEIRTPYSEYEAEHSDKVETTHTNLNVSNGEGTSTNLTLKAPEHAPVAQVAHAEPVHAEPVHAEPTHAEPAHAEPAHPEPVHAEPAYAEPVHAEPVHAESVMAAEPIAIAVAVEVAEAHVEHEPSVMTEAVDEPVVAEPALAIAVAVESEEAEAHAPPQPPKMWFVRFSDTEVIGPITTTDLRAALRAHEIHFHNSVSFDTSQTWLPAYKHPEFADCQDQQPAA